MLIVDDEGAVKGALQQAGFGAIPSTVDEVGAGGASVMDLIAHGLLHGESEIGLRPLLAALDEGQESVALQVLGDSTGNETSEWVYLTAQYLAALYPAFTVKHLLWNDGTQDYDAATTIQTGPSGARYVQIGSFANHIPSAEITAPATDYDVRILVAPTLWSSGATSTMMARFGAGGSRVFRFQLTATGFLVWDYSVAGTTTVGALSTVTVPAATGIANGAPLWLRATHKMDNGSAGTTVTFYTSPDGVTWTILGAAVTVATALTSLFVPAIQEWEIGGRGGNAELFVGRIYETDIRDGIGGPQLAPRMADAWQPVHASTTYGGSPQLTIVNGSMSGAGMTYLSDSTRLPKMTPKWGQTAILLSNSHNDGYSYGPTYIALWDTWLTALKARFPVAQVVILSQNPRTSPATNNREHIIRRRQLMVWAAKNALGFIDVFRAFRLDGRAMATLVDPSDGIHPLPGTGRPLWAAAVISAFLGRRV